MVAELDAHVLGVVLDRGDVLERLIEALVHEPFETIRLNGDEVGHVHDVRNLRKRAAIAIKYCLTSIFVLGHEAFPPSGASAKLRKSCNLLEYGERSSPSRKIFTNCGSSFVVSPIYLGKRSCNPRNRKAFYHARTAIQTHKGAKRAAGSVKATLGPPLSHQSSPAIAYARPCRCPHPYPAARSRRFSRRRRLGSSGFFNFSKLWPLFAKKTRT